MVFVGADPHDDAAHNMAASGMDSNRFMTGVRFGELQRYAKNRVAQNG
jgi:hypothetical protein